MSSAKLGLGTSVLRDQDTLIKYLRTVNNSDYDFIDCAWRYGNEAIIGLSLKFLKREDPRFNLSVKFQSKVWPTQFYGGITKSLKFTLQKIGAISAIDSYMLHRPSPDLNLNLSAWKQLIECRKNRLARRIGLGHFDKDLIEKLYEATGVRPEFLQIELSANNMRYDRIQYCKKHNIEIQAYEPLGNYDENAKNPILIKIAENHNTTVKNVLLAFLMNQDIIPVVIPENEQEIMELLESKKLILSDEEMDEIKKLNDYSSKHFETIEIDFKEENR